MKREILESQYGNSMNIEIKIEGLKSALGIDLTIFIR